MELRFDKIVLDVKEQREIWSQHPEFGCFWSDLNNPRGLKLTPQIEPRKIWLEFVPDKYHSGIIGIAHGGVAVTILDGMMGWFLLSHLGRSGVTTKSITEYFGPLHVGKPYRFEVTLAEAAEINAKAVPLVGKVYDNETQKELLRLRADFFLPNHTQAERILQRQLDPITAKYFPG